MGERFVRAAPLAEVQRLGCLVVHLQGQGIALFADDGHVRAVDRRCPHMGFPLERGTVGDGILTCHWHHARFDLSSGGSFDLWADDVRAYPTLVRDGYVHVDLSPRGDARRHHLERLRDGLEHNIPLVIAKAVIHLLASGEPPAEPLRIGLNFGTRYSVHGWGSGLTMLTAFMNMLPVLDPEDRPRALYQGLAAVAAHTEGDPPRFSVGPLPAPMASVPVLKRWFRRFVEVRDAEGAERCIVSALDARAGMAEMADMLFAAATDHRFIDVGHAVDFTNKALEAVDLAGWDYAAEAFTSLARGYANASRMEEANEWRHPVDLVDIVEGAIEELPAALREGEGRDEPWEERELVAVVLGDDPQAIAEALLSALRAGAAPADVAAGVCHAAALRIARFHTSNEFPDWDTALHTFSFANAVHAGLCRVASAELVRGVFDAAMGVYLDRFLNIPPAPLPQPSAIEIENPDGLLEELAVLLDEQQRITRAGETVARYLASRGDPDRLLAVLGRLLLREDRDFHTIQAVEAAFRQFNLRRGTPEGMHLLVAAARYLAAHAPTVRSQGQTYNIAARLHRGEHLHDG